MKFREEIYEVIKENNRKYMLTAILIASLMLLAGCSGGVTAIALDISEDGSGAEISFSDADKDDFVMGGGLEIGENQKIVIDEDIEEGGSASIRFIGGADKLDENADAEELENAVDPDNYTVEAIVNGSGRSEYGGMDPGSYYIRVDVKNKKTSGTVKITVE